MIKYELLLVEGAPQRNGRELAFLRAIVTPDETHITRWSSSREQLVLVI